MVEADVDGTETVRAQPWEDAGLEEGCFASPNVAADLAGKVVAAVQLLQVEPGVDTGGIEPGLELLDRGEIRFSD